MNNLYFLGGGNMAEAIIKALLMNNSDFRITVIEHNTARQQALNELYPQVKVIAKPETLSKEDILLIAVKPQDVRGALNRLSLNNPLVISIAAGLEIKTLKSYMPNQQRIIRVMPNTPMAVQKGISGVYAPSDEIIETDKNIIESILECTGSYIWVKDEADLHNITAISGSGAGYVFYFMNSLFQAAKQCGFADQVAKQLVEETFYGAVSLAKQSPFTFLELQEKVSSKKGTTLEATQVFDRNHLNDIVEAAVLACKKRSEEISVELE